LVYLGGPPRNGKCWYIFCPFWYILRPLWYILRFLGKLRPRFGIFLFQERSGNPDEELFALLGRQTLCFKLKRLQKPFQR
jgi:hypothetical protein